jgi:hypothetical protein
MVSILIVATQPRKPETRKNCRLHSQTPQQCLRIGRQRLRQLPRVPRSLLKRPGPQPI